MKCKKIIFILFIISLIVFNGSVNTFAMNTGFSTSEMNSKNRDTFLTNINLSLTTCEPQKSAIECFDVSETELIAIGSATAEKKYISVYDTTGEFQYGYVFSCNQSFGVQWDDTDLMIYFVRSDVAALVDSNGAINELRMINDTTDNNSYWNHSVFLQERVLHENRYTIKNNMGLLNILTSSYSQLIKTDSDGNETIIYDVSTAQTSKTIFVIIAVILFALLVISVIVWWFLKAKKK